MPHRAVGCLRIALVIALLPGSALPLVVRAQDSARTPAETLSAAQRATFERGQPVQVLDPVPHLPWPRSRVYQFVDATPEQGAAVLTDYERQATYQPTVKVSRLVNRPSANEAVVHFVIDIPVLPDEAYDMWQQVTCRAGEYTVRWRALGDEASDAPARVSGSARFLPWGNTSTGATGTMLIYEQLVVPGSSLARLGFIRSRGIRASREAATNLARQIERERGSAPDLLETQVRQLRSVLSAADSSSAGDSTCPGT